MTQEEEAMETAAALRKGTRRRWLSHMVTGILFTGALICGGVGFIYRGSGIAGSSLWFLLLVAGMVGAALLVYRSAAIDPEVLTAPMDARAIGALVERLDVSFGSERRAVIRVLIRLLDRVEAADARYISRADRVRLDDALRVPDFFKDAELLSSIIRASERIGDLQSLELIQNLAMQEGDAGRERTVRDAARAALPGLASRVAQQRTGAQLLRASAEIRSSNDLLRASTDSSDSPTSELMRAGDAPGDQLPE